MDTIKPRLLHLLHIIVGSFLFALAINLFVIPGHFGEGGVTGITIILFYLFEWSPWLVSLLLNALLLLIGYRYLDRTTAIYTVIAVALLSVFLHLTETWMLPTDQPLVNAIFGGLFSGVGIGMIIRVGGTTAGSTILARIMQKYLDWNVSYALLLLDLIVVAASFFIIGVQGLMLTIIMLYVATKAMDFIIEGLNPKKAVTIISKEQDHIAAQVTLILDRGVTILYGRGYYTKQSKEILYIVINKQELSMLKKIVRAIDKDAFVTIHDVRDVFGEGFMDISQK